jgi:hypothetical protein
MTGPGQLARHDVPYITAWTGEPLTTPPILATLVGIAHQEEGPYDRDPHGMLWDRRTMAPGLGEPDFGHVHPHRQRRAMLRNLCQVCAGPADLDPLGILWLLKDHRTDRPDWPEAEITTHPPVCLPCAVEAVHRCPHLRTGYTAVRVRQPEIHGVYGTLYRPTGPTGPTTVPVEDGICAYGTPQAAWTIAAQQTRTLTGCTLIDLPAPADQAGTHPPGP